jgi:hypothetical protein
LSSITTLSATGAGRKWKKLSAWMQFPTDIPSDHQPWIADSSALVGQAGSFQLQDCRSASRTQAAGSAPLGHGIAGGGGPPHSASGQGLPGSHEQIGGMEVVQISSAGSLQVSFGPPSGPVVPPEDPPVDPPAPPPFPAVAPPRPAEAPPVPPAAPPVPADAPPVPADAPPVPAEDPPAPVEAPPVPAEAPLVPAEGPLVPAEAPPEAPPADPPAPPSSWIGLREQATPARMRKRAGRNAEAKRARGTAAPS